jgi:hypothetical protein
MEEVRLPDWWSYPRRCANGHAWGPGRVIVRWWKCPCIGFELGDGHKIVTCVTCDWSWYWPPHDACEGEELERDLPPPAGKPLEAAVGARCVVRLGIGGTLML